MKRFGLTIEVEVSAENQQEAETRLLEFMHTNPTMIEMRGELQDATVELD
jgi:hypothetical protein